MDVKYTEIIGRGQLDRGRLAINTMTVCTRDVVIIDLMEKQIIFSVKESFETDGHGSMFLLRENKFVMAVDDNLFSVEY
jgi:hypothetical protein